jgi:PAS domain S-box-containing protein
MRDANVESQLRLANIELNRRIVLLEETLLKKERTEEALQDSEKRYRRLFESAKDGILILDAYTGMVVDANPFLLKLLGYSYNALCGQYIWQLGVFKDIAASKDAFRVLQENEYIRYDDLPLETLDGKPIAVEFVSNVYLVDHSKVIQCNIRDITERKRAREALRHSHERFQRFVDANIVGVVIASPSGAVVEANDYYLRTIGFTREEFKLGLVNWRAITPSEWIYADEHAIEELRERGTSTPYDKEYIRRDGTRVSVFLCLAMLSGPEEQIAAFVLDITERKRMEESLKQSEERFRMVVENAPEAIFVRSGSGHFVYLNHAAVSLFGATSAEELIGRHVLEHFHPDEHTLSAKRIKLLNEGHAVPVVEQTILQMDGSPLTVEISAVPLRYEGMNGALVFARDISERKRAELALQESERGLRQLQKMEAMGTLAGGIAHDFNNILGVMIGYTELAMLDTEELPDVQSNLEQVHIAGLRAQDLVRQILTFSRYTDQEMKPVVVSNLIKEAIKMLRATIPSSIQIKYNIRPRTSAIMADATQIHQVLMNLVTNASHAVQEISTGSIAITLNEEILDQQSASMHPDLKPGNYVVLKVMDNGTGMSPGIVERIFEPFFTTKETGKGSGMGLAVVHGIVKSHGGAITVESVVGEGSTFTVYFPALEKETVRSADTVEPIARGTGRILFVDDEEALALIGQSMLKRLGYKVDIRTSSRDALDAFQANPKKYDLVITDYTMPGMTGLALSEKLLKIRPDIPIILCTGYSEVATPEKVKAAGIRELIMKPVVRQQLAHAVNRIVAMRARKNHKN